MTKIAIIGGGAAGMMAAIGCAMQSTSEVFLFERNPNLGAKVLLSGGGRCNVTTGITDIRKLIENYPRGGKFLMSAFYNFGPEQVMEWFRNHGVKLKTENDLRVFPVSNDGNEIVGVLKRELVKSGVKILLKTQVTAIEKKESGFEITLKSGDFFEVDKVIITTGGSAYKQTGSTGDGYTFAESLGHKITPLAPSLSAFVLRGKRFPAGVSFENVELRVGKFRRTGPCLFTHNGITGPAIFALSSMLAYEKVSADEPVSLFINFFPQETADALEKRLMKFLDEHGKKRLLNILDMFFPKSFCEWFLSYLALDGNLIAAKVDRTTRKKLQQGMQAFELKIIGRSAGDEFVTAGGVDLREVDGRTMQSKIVPGLFFAGEILDVDGFTGGFNLQAAWATGYLAGEKAVL